MDSRTDDFYGTVVHRTQLTPTLVRLVLGGPGMEGWGEDWTDGQAATDSYFVFWFPAPGAAYEAPFSVDAVKDEHPADLWPAHRHYTARAWDSTNSELTVDFVIHGDSGVAGPWASRAQVGDKVVLTQSHGGYRPDRDADWHLMVGDESAFPAIVSALESLGASDRAVAVLLCDGPDHHLHVATEASLEVQWQHRAGRPTDSDLLVDAVRSLDFPEGRVHAFVHGEAGEVREVRRHLLGERAVPRTDLSVSGYWRRTMSDEAWRRVKRDWNADVETDVPA